MKLYKSPYILILLLLSRYSFTSCGSILDGTEVNIKNSIEEYIKSQPAMEIDLGEELPTITQEILINFLKLFRITLKFKSNKTIKLIIGFRVPDTTPKPPLLNVELSLSVGGLLDYNYLTLKDGICKGPVLSLSKYSVDILKSIKENRFIPKANGFEVFYQILDELIKEFENDAEEDPVDYFLEVKFEVESGKIKRGLEIFVVEKKKGERLSEAKTLESSKAKDYVMKKVKEVSEKSPYKKNTETDKDKDEEIGRFWVALFGIIGGFVIGAGTVAFLKRNSAGSKRNNLASRAH